MSKLKRLRGAVGLGIALLVVQACGTGDQTDQAGSEPEVEAPDGDEEETTEPDATEPDATDGDEDGLLDGEMITLIVPFGPGGGYDTDARMLQDRLSEVLGATVVVENQSGAGGLLALNNLMNTPSDGTVLALMNGVGAAGAVITGDAGAQFDFEDLTFVARIGYSDRVITTGPDSDHTIESVQETDLVRFATAGPGDGAHIDATVIGELLELNYEMVAGFEGIGEGRAAVIAGDVDLQGSTADSQGPYIQDGEVVPILWVGEEVDPEIAPDTPTVYEIGLDEETEAVFDEYIALLQTGRMVVGPPGMDDAVVDELSRAFEEALDDDDLIEQMNAAGRTVNYLDADGSRELAVNLTANASDRFRNLLSAAYE